METKITHDMEEHFRKGHSERPKYDPGLIIHYKIRINDDYFEVEKADILGQELAELVDLDLETHAIYSVEHGHETEIVSHQIIDLGGYGIERFITGPKNKHRYVIIVNGTPEEIEEKVVTYDEIVTFAFPDYPQHKERNYSVKYKNGPGEKPEGILSKGASVKVKNKMIFDVTPTGQS